MMRAAVSQGLRQPSSRASAPRQRSSSGARNRVASRPRKHARLRRSCRPWSQTVVIDHSSTARTHGRNEPRTSGHRGRGSSEGAASSRYADEGAGRSIARDTGMARVTVTDGRPRRVFPTTVGAARPIVRTAPGTQSKGGARPWRRTPIDSGNGTDHHARSAWPLPPSSPPRHACSAQHCSQLSGAGAPADMCVTRHYWPAEHADRTPLTTVSWACARAPGPHLCESAHQHASGPRLGWASNVPADIGTAQIDGSRRAHAHSPWPRQHDRSMPMPLTHTVPPGPSFRPHPILLGATRVHAALAPGRHVLIYSVYVRYQGCCQSALPSGRHRAYVRVHASVSRVCSCMNHACGHLESTGLHGIVRTACSTAGVPHPGKCWARAFCHVNVRPLHSTHARTRTPYVTKPLLTHNSSCGLGVGLAGTLHNALVGSDPARKMVRATSSATM